MPAVTAFQEGAQFGAEQEKRELDIEATQRRERGINALAEEFGPGARAPQEFAAVTGAGRAERRLASDIEQRRLKSERATIEQEQADVDRDRAERLRAARLLAGQFKAGQDAGVPARDTAARSSAIFEALGVDPEQVEGLVSRMETDPTFAAELEGSLRFAEKRGVNRAFGKPLEIANPDGSISLWQRFTHGPPQLLSEGGRTLSGALRERGLEQKEPLFKGRVEEEKKIGAARGEIRATDLPPGRRQVATAKEVLSAKRQKAKFVDKTIEKAIGQASAWSTGLGSVFSAVPGSDAANLEATLATVKSNIGFGELDRMRKESPTGGALGQVSNIENTLLQSVWGALLASQSKEQFVENMKDLRSQQRLSFKRLARQYEIDFGVPYAGEGSPLNLPLAEGQQDIDAIINKYPVPGQ